MSRLARFLLMWAIAPPIMACVCYVMIRGWSALVHGGRAPEGTIRRERLEFKLMIALFYLVALVVGIVKGVF